MSWLRFKIWLLKYRILLALCALLLAVLAWDIATTENKLYIQTAQPEDNFVIVCGWYSGFLSLHGGQNRVNYRVLVGKSNTELDCGWSLYGHIQVTVSHPLYRQIYGYDDPELISPDFRYQDGRMVFTPVPFDQYLDSLQNKYEGEELVDQVGSLIGGHFSYHYFRDYAYLREPDIEYLKSLYNDRLIKFLQPAYDRYDFGKGGGSPESVVTHYWERWKEYNEGK